MKAAKSLVPAPAPSPAPSSTPTSFRLSADIRKLLTQAAERERSSQTSMLEVMVQQLCERNGIRAKRGAR